MEHTVLTVSTPRESDPPEMQALDVKDPGTGALQVAIAVFTPNELWDPLEHTAVTYCVLEGTAQAVLTVAEPTVEGFPFTQVAITKKPDEGVVQERRTVFDPRLADDPGVHIVAT